MTIDQVVYDNSVGKILSLKYRLRRTTLARNMPVDNTGGRGVAFLFIIFWVIGSTVIWLVVLNLDCECAFVEI